MNIVTKLRKSSIRFLRVMAMNLGLLPAAFFILPMGPGHWVVKPKRQTPGAHVRWAPVTYRRGTADLSTFVHIFIREDYSLTRLARYPEIMAEYERILSSGRRPLIIDCGANIGLASLYLSLCFPQAYVVGIEPESANVAAAAKHASPNISLLRAALSNQDGQLAISNPDAAADAFRVEHARAGQAETVPGYSMSTIIAQAAQRHANVEPFLAKIDIEGFEDIVFSSDTDWVDRFKVLAIELHDWMLPGRAASRNFLQAVTRKPRDFVHIGDIAFSIRNDTA
jgi:FkbM family methyltransferase